MAESSQKVCDGIHYYRDEALAPNRKHGGVGDTQVSCPIGFLRGADENKPKPMLLDKERAMRCDQKLYVPKKNLIDPLQLRKMLGSFIDPYDYGVDLGNKQIIHCNTLEKLNLIFSPVLLPSAPNSTESDWSFFRKNLYHQNKRQYQVRLSRAIIDSHMTQQKTYYYTSNPFSPYMLMGFDVDNHTSDPQQIKPFLELFESHFPSFYDRGSSGKSLHYFPKINMLPLYEHYIELCLDGKTTLSWAKYANNVM